VIKIGTRKSKLALWQANYVADLLNDGGLKTQLVPIETKGDKIQHVTIAKIGSKGVFTEELEAMLSIGKIDIAVHSAKDLQSSLPSGFNILSFCERETPDDVILSEKEIDLNAPNLILGTSSTRRKALLKHFYPKIKTVEARGNLQTRIEKLRSGMMDGLILAHAGVKRMGYDGMIQYKFDMERFTPPVGQGSVAIEIHESINAETAKKIKSLTNHPATEKVLKAERAFLKKMDGGCSIPVFGYAQLSAENQLIMTGGIASLDGKEILKRTFHGSNPQELGIRLADEILEIGGKKILADIKDMI